MAKQLSLSWEWIVILLPAALVVGGIEWMPRMLQGTLDAGAKVSLIVGGLALAVSAYAAFSANKMKTFEIERGYRAARSIVQADAEEALGESQEMVDHLMSRSGDDKDEWNLAVDELRILGRRYERRQDQLAFLSTHFSPADFLVVQQLYLTMLRMFRRSEQLLIDDRIPSKDVPGLVANRQKELQEEFKKSQKAALGKYQELQLGELPEDLYRRLASL